MLPKTRLGKRSPLGALVSSSCTAACTSTNQDTGETDISVAKGRHCISRVRAHPGQKVSSQCGEHGSSGSVDQVDFIPTHNSVLRRVEDVWPSSSSSSSEVQPIIRSVSSCIDVPRRRAEEVDVDEMMAAMILTSLSCSPLLHSPTHPDTTAPPTESVGGELSDSGYWSVGCSNESPVPSPPITESDGGSATPPDEGLDMDVKQVLFDEPSPRKRRNSVKVVFRCLWPSCEKILTSVVGIKRHIRTTHLSRSGEQEHCSRSEEDFYYTEIHQWDKRQQSPPPARYGPASPISSSPSPPLPSPPSSSPPLSRSAPSGSFWQVHTEHSYQATPPTRVVSAAASNSASWIAPPPIANIRQVGSLSVGEQWPQQHIAPCRRIRGEAKKCRKVYGIEHREQWCTACRWKKACQRFID